MTLPQKSFGEFVTERHGRNWVYAARMTDRIAARYNKPDCPAVVITPKQQKQLAVDYKVQWGREHDPEFWAMLCALRAIHTHAANRDNCPATVEALAVGALKVVGVALAQMIAI